MRIIILIIAWWLHFYVCSLLYIIQNCGTVEHSVFPSYSFGFENDEAHAQLEPQFKVDWCKDSLNPREWSGWKSPPTSAHKLEC